MHQKRRDAWYWAITGSLLAEFESSPSRSARKRFGWDAWHVSRRTTNTTTAPGGFQDASCFLAMSCVHRPKYIILLSYRPPALPESWAEKHCIGMVLKSSCSGEYSNLRWSLEQDPGGEKKAVSKKREIAGKERESLECLGRRGRASRRKRKEPRGALSHSYTYPHSATPKAERTLYNF